MGPNTFNFILIGIWTVLILFSEAGRKGRTKRTGEMLYFVETFPKYIGFVIMGLGVFMLGRTFIHISPYMNGLEDGVELFTNLSTTITIAGLYIIIVRNMRNLEFRENGIVYRTSYVPWDKIKSWEYEKKKRGPGSDLIIKSIDHKGMVKSTRIRNLGPAVIEECESMLTNRFKLSKIHRETKDKKKWKKKKR